MDVPHFTVDDQMHNKYYISYKHTCIYHTQEVANLLDGVEKMGRSWNAILYTYQFHSSRTSTDLKDKYKQLVSPCFSLVLHFVFEYCIITSVQIVVFLIACTDFFVAFGQFVFLA